MKAIWPEGTLPGKLSARRTFNSFYSLAGTLLSIALLNKLPKLDTLTLTPGRSITPLTCKVWNSPTDTEKYTNQAITWERACWGWSMVLLFCIRIIAAFVGIWGNKFLLIQIKSISIMKANRPLILQSSSPLLKLLLPFFLLTLACRVSCLYIHGVVQDPKVYSQ